MRPEKPRKTVVNVEKKVVIVMSFDHEDKMHIEEVVSSIAGAVPVVERIISQGKHWSLLEKVVKD